MFRVEELIANYFYHKSIRIGNRLVMKMMNKIILAVCSTVVVVVSNQIIKWLEHKLEKHPKRISES